MKLSRRLAAEAVGTAFLLAVVVGSGIMGERLAAGNAAITLLANSVATGCGLWVLITIFGPISGAHFNPAVTLSFAAVGEFAWRDVLPYVSTQIVFAYAGVAAAHVMFDLPLFTASERARGPKSMVERSCGDGWIDADDLAWRPRGSEMGRRSGGRLYYRRLLVHRLNFICEPGGDLGASRNEYLRGHSSF